MKELTNKEIRVYLEIKKYIELNQYPPTLRELCDILNINSVATAQYYVNQLKEKGYIICPPYKNRAIRIIRDLDGVHL